MEYQVQFLSEFLNDQVFGASCTNIHETHLQITSYTRTKHWHLFTGNLRPTCIISNERYYWSLKINRLLSYTSSSNHPSCCFLSTVEGIPLILFWVLKKHLGNNLIFTASAVGHKTAVCRSQVTIEFLVGYMTFPANVHGCA